MSKKDLIIKKSLQWCFKMFLNIEQENEHDEEEQKRIYKYSLFELKTEIQRNHYKNKKGFENYFIYDFNKLNKIYTFKKLINEIEKAYKNEKYEKNNKLISNEKYKISYKEFLFNLWRFNKI